MIYTHSEDIQMLNSNGKSEIVNQIYNDLKEVSYKSYRKKHKMERI